MLRKWSRNVFDDEEDAYETPIFIYSRELDIPILISSIIRSDVEKDNSPPYPKDVVTKCLNLISSIIKKGFEIINVMYKE